MGIIFSSFNGLEPRLRFPSFDNKWTLTTIGNVCAFTNGKAHEQNVVEYGEYIIVNSKFISSDGVVKKYSNKQICPLFKNDIVMVMSDVPNGKAMSKCFCIDKDNKYTLNQRICALRTEQIPLYYMMQINRSDYFMKFDDGVKQTNLRKDDVLACPVYSTTIKEQTKIADFFSLVDQRIEKQRLLVESLKKYKRGVIQYYFDNILGESIKLKNILIEVDEKTKINNQHPVISSTKQGLFWQDDYFNKDIASSDNKGYKILRRGQVVFSPQNLWMGNINYNEDFEIGIVSPSYKIYDINKMFDPYFVSVLLKTPIAMKEFFLASEQGASIVRRNLKMDLFENITFQIPSLDKQKDISIRLYKLQKNLDLNIKILDYLIKFKQGLLQQMFI